jgi:hypothetical protein
MINEDGLRLAMYEISFFGCYFSEFWVFIFSLIEFLSVYGVLEREADPSIGCDFGNWTFRSE